MDELGYQGRTEEQQRSMHLIGGISGTLFLIAIPLTIGAYLFSLLF